LGEQRAGPLRAIAGFLARLATFIRRIVVAVGDTDRRAARLRTIAPVDPTVNATVRLSLNQSAAWRYPSRPASGFGTGARGYPLSPAGYGK
jgi:hypothetical protein